MEHGIFIQIFKFYISIHFILRLIKGKECSKCVKQAYDVGFRLFDSAAMYNNESAICKAFNEGKFDTSKTFVTTKLLPSDHGYEPAKRAFTQSWELLTNKERPIDLYLIHWPGTYHHCTVDQLKKTRRETWRALEEMYRKVCYFTVSYIIFSSHFFPFEYFN